MALKNYLGPLKPILRPLVHWVRGGPGARPVPLQVDTAPRSEPEARTESSPDLSVLNGLDVPRVTYEELHRRLGVAEPFVGPAVHGKPFSAWRMEDDDSPIFRFIYRSWQPRRHLEFGTFQGTGTLYCLAESSATVWTINLLEGESRADGTWAYGCQMAEKEIGHLWRETSASGEGLVSCRTDSLGFIGRYYREADLSHRVCQIYCDSTRWDTSNYPPGFFDTVLIDGGHSYDIVASDTRKACEVVRAGGIVMWHDYCPDVEALTACTSPRDVVRFIRDHQEWLATQFRELFWVFPSWILVGIKR
jgi:predicted O-methyltransferase YrrM